MVEPIAHHFGGKAYIKETRVAAGEILVQHKHAHDHLSYLVQGSVLVLVDGETRRVDAPACLHIVAGKHHGVRALTPAIWLCVHGTDCTDPDKIDQVLIVESGEDLHAMARSML